MNTKSLSLAYVALLALLAITLCFSFPYSLYLFATLKSMIILFVFMGVMRTDQASRIYLLLAFVTLAIMILFVWDDMHFR